MFSKFNPGCCCVSNVCRSVYYPHTLAGMNPDLASRESNFFYALNVADDEEFYNPVTNYTGLYKDTFQPLNDGKLSEVGVIIFTSPYVCFFQLPSYGYSELQTYVRRGKSIVQMAEHGSCLGVNGIAVVSSNVGNLGGGPGLIIEAVTIHVGCERIENLAYDSVRNNLNWNLPQWGLGGSGRINMTGGSSALIVASGNGNLVAGAISNLAGAGDNGKIILCADANMAGSCNYGDFDTLLENICLAETYGIFQVDPEWTPSDY